MKNKKVVFIIIIVFIILLTATYFQNPKLLDRALYRVGIQEQVCFSENAKFQKSGILKKCIFSTLQVWFLGATWGCGGSARMGPLLS